MKKKLLWIFVVIVVLIAAVLGYAAYNANSLIAKYKPDLEAIASNALQSDVTLGALSVKIFPETAIKVAEVRIARSKTSKEALTLNDLNLSLNLLPLLTGKLVINELSLEKPSITFLKSKDGITIQGLPPAEKSGADKPAVRNEAPAEKKPAAPAKIDVPIGLNLEKFLLSNAHIKLHDVDTNQDIAVENLTVKTGLAVSSDAVRISNLSVDGGIVALNLPRIPFSVKSESIIARLPVLAVATENLTISFLGNSISVAVDTKLQPLAGKASISSSGIDLASFNEIITAYAKQMPALAGITLSGKVTPKGSAAFDGTERYDSTMNIGLANVGAKAPQGTVSNANGAFEIKADANRKQVFSKDFSVAVNNETIKLDLDSQITATEATVKTLTLALLGGTVTAPSKLSLSGTQNFSSEFRVSDIDLGRAIGMAKPGMPIPVTGTLKNVNGAISGTLGETLLKSLRGDIVVAVGNTTIKNFNLVSKVLGAVKGLPFTTGSLAEQAPESERAALSSPDTALSSIDVKTRIADGIINLTDLTAVAPLFMLTGSGTATFAGTLDLQNQFIFSAPFSSALALRVPDLKNFYDSEKRLVIPLKIIKNEQATLILPDINKLLSLAGGKILEKKGQELLNGLFKNKKFGF